MPHADERPSDDEVCAILRQKGSLTGDDLVAALETDYSARQIQRAIRRCLDRGKIELGRDLELVLVRERVAA